MGIAISGAIAQEDENLIRQWATSATATSEFSSDGWNAMQATGEPDTEECGDIRTAWASASSSGVDTLTVYFETPVYPTQVNIYQTYNPGSITGISLIAYEDDTVITVNNSADPGDAPCPGVLTVNLLESAELPLVIGVNIKLDQREIGDWNEIDAVELVGIPEFSTEETTDDSNSALEGLPLGRSVTCDNGESFDNGIEVKVVQMRTRSIYTVTAIGLNGFDPVLAVLGESGRGLCNDDDRAATAYGAALPTSGEVAPSGTSAQIIFENRDTDAFSDITFVVGGRNNMSGEFILIVEGMTLSSADGAGDVFSVLVSPGMIASEINLNAYMISVTEVFDPVIATIDAEYNFVQDADKNYIACDDAGVASLCWGESTSLAGFYVSRSENRALPGGSKDAMLSMPLKPEYVGGYYNFIMRSTGNTYGDYIVAFHMGIGEP
jgi:hypothetical protein